MKITEETVIPVEKLTAYLLAPRSRDDKSKFLAQAGSDRNDPDTLPVALRRFADTIEAVEDGVNEYGTFYRVEGDLTGPTGHSLRGVMIWFRWSLDGTMHFVTLKPVRADRA